ncbi:MAG: hypothetical protein KJ609_01025 [Gammaproteobacteria bacterium]|nr:hypothetical protein [Gammaproteobacteria bacterium]MBU1468904.1 hypothetical protein [Gammaproteobacteria bacterium]MBU2023471.1 hypothetical protein [Gammaproteobacteria bacterium]MBU2239042.1 hypothetical protein [Gammaproteobacteria bacterium]MBU2317114.1 hypothetical protein [Gammaproteobacteria bacterium]
MLTSLIRFAFISFLFSSAAVFSADNVSNSTEPSAPQISPQSTSNTQLPKWFYRELTSIRKDVSVLDVTGASKEQILELKERIGKVEVRLEESQLRVDDKLFDQVERIRDIADSNSFSITLFSVIAGVLGTLIALLSLFLSWKANREAVANAKDEAQRATSEWIKGVEKEITDKLEGEINGLSQRFDTELQDVRENAEIQSIKTMLNRAISMASGGKYTQALEELDITIEKYHDYKSFEIQEQVAFAMLYKGGVLQHLSRNNEALSVYNDVISKFIGIDLMPLRNQVSSAFACKAEVYVTENNKEGLEQVISQAIDFMGDYFPVDRAVIEMFRFIKNESNISELWIYINKINDHEKIIWEFETIKNIINELASPVKEQVQACVRFFDTHKDKAKLKEELDQIPEA